ncbi:tyrosine-type recombinase/integrase [Alcaligenaceae bacterium]|nr:tyrosine-type recombinase/integrase [Alcaligenaceae bacterium]
MSKNSISNDQLLALRPRDKEYLFDCGDSLFLRVRPNGGKTWVRRYTRLDGERSRMGLGIFPKVTLDAALKENISISLAIDAGQDPRHRNVEKKVAQLRASLDTFEKVGREWHRHASMVEEWSPSYSAKILRMLELHAFPRLGKFPITLIHPPEIETVLLAVSAAGTRETANRLREKLALIFGRTVTLKILAPGQNFMAKGVANFSLPKPRKRRFATIKDPAKIGQLMRDLQAYQGHLVTRSALLIMPYLFQRPGQIRHMQWAHLDLDRGFWTCPPEIMKMVHREKDNDDVEDHIVPLPHQAVDILVQLHKFSGHGEYVFRGISRRRNKDGSYTEMMSDNTINKAIRRMGYSTQKDITGHGFRSMARTLLVERLGWDKDIVERHLAHVSREELGNTYDRAEFVKQRAKMIQEWADYLDGLRDNPDESESSSSGTADNNVVPMRRRLAS